MNKILIIGGGNGAFALAAHLTKLGANVNLTDVFPEYLEELKCNGNSINLRINKEESIEKISMVTSDIQKALKEVKLIMVVTPSYTHKIISKRIAPFLKDGQMILLNPGRTAGALEMFNNLRKFGSTANVIVGEAQTLIFSCRKLSKTSVEIYGIKDKVGIASIPSEKSLDMVNELKPYYKQFYAEQNCLITSFSNIGAIFHPAPLVFNIGRVESNEKYLFYKEGITPSIAKFLEKLDGERINTAKSFSVSVLSCIEWLKKIYFTTGNNLYENLQNNQAYSQIYGPNSINVRYLTEEVPMSLVPISELANSIGIETPMIDSIIEISSILLNKDFRKEGRNLNNLGLKGKNKMDIIKIFINGDLKE